MIFYHPGGKIIIGDNVFLGENATVLRNVRIGNNCIIGAGAVVTKDIPDNSVAAGVPAKVIMGLEQYYDLKKKNILDEIERNINDIYMLKGRMPFEEEMANFRIFYMPRTKENYDKILKNHILGGTPERDIELYNQIHPMFGSYNEMIEYFSEK